MRPRGGVHTPLPLFASGILVAIEGGGNHGGSRPSLSLSLEVGDCGEEATLSLSLKW